MISSPPGNPQNAPRSTASGGASLPAVDPLGTADAYSNNQDHTTDVQDMTAPYRNGRVQILIATVLEYDRTNNRLRIGLNGPPGRETFAQTGGLPVPSNIAGRQIRVLKNSDPNALEAGGLYFDDVVP